MNFITIYTIYTYTKHKTQNPKGERGSKKIYFVRGHQGVGCLYPLRSFWFLIRLILQNRKKSRGKTTNERTNERPRWIAWMDDLSRRRRRRRRHLRPRVRKSACEIGFVCVIGYTDERHRVGFIHSVIHSRTRPRRIGSNRTGTEFD